MKKSLFIDCTKGLASDMLVAALLDCIDDSEKFLHEMQVKICNNMVLNAEYVNSYERRGLIFKACDRDYNPSLAHMHAHTSLKEVYEFIDNSDFSSAVKNLARGVYDLIAKAEAHVHGESCETVHFHEVGSKRAIACILCACAAFDSLSADEIIFSPINTGYGKVVCAHGEVDVPAPATAELLNGMPSFSLPRLKGELCTPTGAALAKYFATDFKKANDILLEKFELRGTGLGTKDIGEAGGILIFESVS